MPPRPKGLPRRNTLHPQGRANRQAALARLGQQALQDLPVPELLDQTIGIVAESLQAEFAETLEFLADGRTLLLRAGRGWQPGLIGVATVHLEQDELLPASLLHHSPLVYQLPQLTGAPPASLFHNTGISSGLRVLIPGTAAPYGLLGIHSARPRRFTSDDSHFLRATANILGLAVARQRVEELLGRSKQQLAEAQHIAHLGSWEWDIQNDRISWSDELYRIYGLDPDSFPAGYQAFLSAVHPDDRERVDQQVTRAIREGVPFAVEHRTMRPDGTERVLYGRGEVVRGPDGRPQRLVGTGQDITDLKEAEGRNQQLLLERMARTQAEAAEQRLTFLAEASAILGASIDYETTLASVAKLAVPHLADWFTVHLVEADGQVRNVAYAHRTPGKVPVLAALVQRYPPNPRWEHHPLAELLRTRQPQLIVNIPSGWAESVASDAEHLRLLRELAPVAQMMVPLVARSQLLGLLVFASAESGRQYSSSDLALAQELAGRAAVAIDNAMLYRAQHDARSAVEAEHQRLLTVLEQIPVGVVIAGQHGETLLANSAAQALGVAPASHSLDVPWLQVLPPNMGMLPPAAEPPLRRALRGETVLNTEMVLLASGRDPLVLLVNAAPIVDEQGQNSAAVVVYQDITQRKSLEQLKDEFLSLAAHELKTPLTIIKGASQLLLRAAAQGRPLGQREAQLLSQIAQRTDHVSRLVNELLDLTRIEQDRLDLHPERLDLAALLSQIMIQQEELHSDRPLLLAGGSRPVWGVWDRGRLEQVFTNLLDNAVKYNPVGGTVQVTIRQTSNEVHVAVEDHGIGIPSGDLPRIFERHFRAGNANRASTGLGLGLYLTSQIVQRHGGRIWAESREGEGSVFHVVLPRDMS